VSIVLGKNAAMIEDWLVKDVTTLLYNEELTFVNNPP